MLCTLDTHLEIMRQCLLYVIINRIQIRYTSAGVLGNIIFYSLGCIGIGDVQMIRRFYPRCREGKLSPTYHHKDPGYHRFRHHGRIILLCKLHHKGGKIIARKIEHYKVTCNPGKQEGLNFALAGISSFTSNYSTVIFS